MKRSNVILLTALLLFFTSYAYAVETKAHVKALYKPQSSENYKKIQKSFPAITDDDIEASINISQDPSNIELINNMLKFLRNRGLAKKIKIPPIYLLLFNNEDKNFFPTGALYMEKDGIMVINAKNLYTVEANKKGAYMYENERITADFVYMSAILSHELMHHEDTILEDAAMHFESDIASEKNAYERSAKVLNYFLKITSKEASAIQIDKFYDYVMQFSGLIAERRDVYIKAAKGADILLKNRLGVCMMLNMEISAFDKLNYRLKSVSEDEIIALIAFAAAPVILDMKINLKNVEINILNPEYEIKRFHNDVGGILVLDGKTYTKKLR